MSELIASGATFVPGRPNEATGVTETSTVVTTPNAALAPATASMCFPFYTHCGVLGGDKQSAQGVATILTATAFAPQDYSLATVATIGMDYSASHQLKKDSRLADRIYTGIVGEMGKDVAVADIEKRFRFEWREVDVPDQHGVARRYDPYFAQHITTSICESFRHFLFSLPHRLAALPGLSASQTIDSLKPQLNHACNVFYNRLGPFLAATVPGASHEQLLEEARACAKELIKLHTDPMRHLINLQLSALRVLQRICSAVLADEPIDEMLFHSDDVLHVLADYPPYQLLDELSRHRVPFAELAGFLTSASRSGVRGASQLPPSGAARELAVQRWAKRYGETVLNCLVPVRQSLGVLSTSQDHASVWHGILVADKSAMVVNVAVQTGGPTAAVLCTPAQHTHSLDNLMLVATSISDPAALLVPRLARVVVQLVENNCLSVRKVKADMLLPLVCRWDCAAIVERERLLAARLTPLLQETGTQLRDGQSSDGESSMSESDDAERSRDPSPQRNEADFPTAISTTATPLDNFGPRITSGSVPLSLERDHAIVVCARDLLKERGGTASTPNGVFVLTVKAVVSRVLLRAYDSLKASERSTSQSVGCVYTKVVQQFGPEMGVEYWKIDQPWPHANVMGRPKSAGLVLTQQGLELVLKHFDSIVEEMRSNGTAFAKTWFPSRSARSHSRRSLWQRRHGVNGSRGETGIGAAAAAAIVGVR